MMNQRSLLEYMKQANITTYIKLVSETGTQATVLEFSKSHVFVSNIDYEESSDGGAYYLDSWGEAWKLIKELESEGYTRETELRVSPKSFVEWS